MNCFRGVALHGTKDHPIRLRPHPLMPMNACTIHDAIITLDFEQPDVVFSHCIFSRVTIILPIAMTLDDVAHDCTFYDTLIRVQALEQSDTAQEGA